jgi:hypothetical protein
MNDPAHAVPFLLLVLAAFGTATAANAPDWRYAGYTEVNGAPHHLFFDADSVTVTSGKTIRVWTKAISQKNLDVPRKDEDPAFADRSARKLSSGYTPRFLQLPSVQKKYPDKTALRELAGRFTRYETKANSPVVPDALRMYFEIDCSGQRILLLQAFDERGQQGEIRPDWQFIAPDTNAQWLSMMLCARNAR